jgi:glycosyltransferase involved in cell wall biosynthesis
VLSWSLLEAMSAGCAIVASDTQPLKEAIVHNETGLLTDFFDPKALVQSVVKLLESPRERQRLSNNARKFAQSHYDLQNVCLPKQIKWVTSLLINAA